MESKAGHLHCEAPDTPPHQLILLFASRAQQSTIPAITLLTRVKVSFPVAQLFMSSAAVWIVYGIFSK